MVKLVSVSLRVDEVAAIPEYMKKNPAFKTRHEVIKFAIRRLLFPDEKTNIPLDGVATVHPKEDGHPEHITIEKSEPEKTLTIIPEKRLEIISDEEADNRRKKGESTNEYN